MALSFVIPIGIALLAAFIGLDIYLAVDRLPGNTWSEILRQWAIVTPLIPWIYGILGGHFYHPVDGLDPWIDPPGNIALLVWLTAVIGLIGVAFAKSGNPISPWTVVIPGFIAGALLWPV